MSNKMVGQGDCHFCGAQVKYLHGFVSDKTPGGLVYYSCIAEVEGRACGFRGKLGERASVDILEQCKGAKAGEAKTETVKKVLDDVPTKPAKPAKADGPGKDKPAGNPDKPATGSGFRPIFS